MQKDLLFELGVEELPSGIVKTLGMSLAKNLKDILKTHGITHEKVTFFSAPRRVAVLISNLSEIIPGTKISRRGPPIANNDKNSQSVIGFAKSLNVSVDELTTLESDKGKWWFYEYNTADKATKELLPTLINEAVKNLPIQKPMRWGNGEYEFIRPVHWVVLLFGNEVIKTKIYGIESGNKSYGHRFHHAHEVLIKTPFDYEQALEKAFVIADFAKRKNIVINKVQKLAQEKNLLADMPENLIDEVVSIVEWPQPLLISFDEKFLQVPQKALVASITNHQKCFPVKDQDGNLKPYFITVSNIVSEDKDSVIKGNQSVMKARLSDAAFFFEKDSQTPLIEYNTKLSKVIFQEKLGTLEEKISRHKKLVSHLTLPLQLDKNKVLRAIDLSKCDLMTNMVGEFPELQGYMGEQYALLCGEDKDIAKALYEQYLPRFADDKLPISNLGIALSLIDRIDILVGIFAIGKKPTGMKDPFKLRRHSLAVVRLLTENSLNINLSTLIEQAFNSLDYLHLPEAKEKIQELKPFILDRLDAFYEAQGIKSDIVDSVRVKQEDWLYDMHQRVQALNDFKQTADAYALSQACKRVSNILQGQGIENLPQVVDVNVLIEPAEKELFEKINIVENLLVPFYKENNYKTVLKELSRLKNPIDKFFDTVLVLADDDAIKHNRLALLKKLQKVLSGVADISLLNIKLEEILQKDPIS